MGTKALTLAVLGEASYGNVVRSYGIGNHVDLCGLPGAGVGHRLERALHEFGVGAPSGAAAIGYASLRHRRSLRRSDAADRVWHRLASAARASCARAAGVHRRHACLYGPRTDRANEPLDRFAQRPLCARRHILSDAPGRLPFSATDPMEWVHCHIARKPATPAERLESVPTVISEIVMKLLAKTAEERYHSRLFCGAERARQRRSPRGWSSAQQSRREFASTVSTTRTGHAAVSKREDATEIQLSPCSGPQPFQPGTSPHHPRNLHTTPCRRAG
jgi:hypothetical protein